MADLSQTTANVRKDTSKGTKTAMAGEAIDAGMPIYEKAADGKMYKCINSTAAAAACDGIVQVLKQVQRAAAGAECQQRGSREKNKYILNCSIAMLHRSTSQVWMYCPACDSTSGRCRSRSAAVQPCPTSPGM